MHLARSQIATERLAIAREGCDGRSVARSRPSCTSIDTLALRTVHKVGGPVPRVESVVGNPAVGAVRVRSPAVAGYVALSLLLYSKSHVIQAFEGALIVEGDIT